MNDAEKQDCSVIEEIRRRLQRSLSPTYIEVIDESYLHQGHAHGFPENTTTHVRIRLWSDVFENEETLLRHRRVNAVLADLYKKTLHAVAIEISPEKSAP